jgi:hypothetical protein
MSFSKKSGATKGKVDSKAWSDPSLAKNWKKAKDMGGGGFDQPKIPEGDYTAQLVSAQTGLFPAKPAVGKPSSSSYRPAQPVTPWFILRFVVQTAGDAKGMQPYRRDTLAHSDETKAIEAINRFQRTLDTIGYNVEDITPAELPKLAEAISKEKPVCKIRIKFGGDSGQYLNLNVLSLVETNGRGGKEK